MPPKYTCQDCKGPASTVRALRCHACAVAARQPIARTCEHCGESFHRPASAFSRSKRFYCSRQCAGPAKRKIPPVAVYAIIHRETLLAYIGSSNNIPSRWSTHRRDLATGRHPNRVLSELWDQAGADAFEFRILEPVADDSALRSREQAWLDWWKRNGLRVFNRAPNTVTTAGIKYADEARAQMRANPKRKFRGKLSEDAVRAIKRRARNGEDFHQLAAEFNIHRHTVYMIASGRMWPDVS
jgi:group I intron endonuclease